jgi:trichohyalin
MTRNNSMNLRMLIREMISETNKPRSGDDWTTDHDWRLNVEKDKQKERARKRKEEKDALERSLAKIHAEHEQTMRDLEKKQAAAREAKWSKPKRDHRFDNPNWTAKDEAELRAAKWSDEKQAALVASARSKSATLWSAEEAEADRRDGEQRMAKDREEMAAQRKKEWEETLKRVQEINKEEEERQRKWKEGEPERKRKAEEEERIARLEKAEEERKEAERWERRREEREREREREERERQKEADREATLRYWQRKDPLWAHRIWF